MRSAKARKLRIDDVRIEDLDFAYFKQSAVKCLAGSAAEPQRFVVTWEHPVHGERECNDADSWRAALIAQRPRLYMPDNKAFQFRICTIADRSGRARRHVIRPEVETTQL